MMIPDKLASGRVLVGDSVFENAQLIVRDGWLHIEFEADDLEPIALDLASVLSEGEGRNPKAAAHR